MSFCVVTRVVLFEFGLEEMQGGKETADLSSDVFLVVSFTMLNRFFVFAEKTILGFQSVQQLLKHFED